MDGLAKALKNEWPLLAAAICVFLATLVCLYSNLPLPAHWRNTPINWQNLAAKPHWVTGRLTNIRLHDDNPDRLTLYLSDVTGYQTTGIPAKLALGVNTHRFQNLLAEAGNHQNLAETGVVGGAAIPPPSRGARHPLGVIDNAAQSAQIPSHPLTLLSSHPIAIAAQILLFPPDAPAFPGDRDFRPFSRYKAEVGHGYVQGRLALTTLPGNPPCEAQPQLSQPSITQPSCRPPQGGMASIGGLQQSSAIDNFRADITQKTNKLAQGTVTALLVGDTSGIPPEVNNAYRNAGLSHLLAISGMQLSVAGLGIFWLVRRLLACWPRLALTHNIRLYAALVGLAAVPLYTLIAGAGVSVVRAAVMVSFFLAAVVAGRVSGALRAWAVALAGMCLLWPESALTAGFQLSFSATLGLILAQAAGILGAGKGHGRLAWMLGHLRQFAVTSLVAGLATLPLVAYIFGQVSLVSLPANLVAVPLMGALGTWLSLVVLALWPLHLGWLALSPLVWVCQAANAIAAYAAHLPQAQVIVPQSFSLPLAGLCLVAFLLCCMCEWLWAVIFTFAIFGLATAASLCATPPTIAVLNGGEIVLSRTSGRQFRIILAPSYTNAATRWARRWGHTLSPEKPQPGQCDSTGCAYQTPAGPVTVLNGAPTPDDCHRAVVIITNQNSNLCPAKTFIKNTRRWAYYP